MPESPRKPKARPMMYQEEDSSTDEEYVSEDEDEELQYDGAMDEYKNPNKTTDDTRQTSRDRVRTLKEAVYTTKGAEWRDILRERTFRPVELPSVSKGLTQRRR